MTQKLLVVSPTPSLAAELEAALASTPLAEGVEVLTEYPDAAALRDLVDSAADTVTSIIVDLRDRDRALDLIRQAKVVNPRMVAIAADTDSSADRILAAMRAGASEYLIPPFDLQGLQKTLLKASAEKGPQTEGKVICFLPAQGGNGASTAALNIANLMGVAAKAADPEAKRVLLIDFDFHSGTIGFRLRLKPEYTVADALSRPDFIHELWERVTIEWERLDILASPSSVEPLPADSLGQVPAVLRSAAEHYDWIVVDLPPALYSSCIDVLSVADKVCLVCTPEVLSLHLARRRLNELVRAGIDKEKTQLIVNRAGSRKALSPEDIAKVVGVPVKWRLSNDYAAVTDADLSGGLVAGNSQLHREFERIAVGLTELKVTRNGNRRWKGFLSFG